MKQLREIQAQNSMGTERSGHLGIIYLSWQLPSIAEKNPDTENRELWRLFIERESEAVMKSSILYEGLQWMNDDLFIYMHLPHGRQHVLEGWLLELAYKHTGIWERDFLVELSSRHLRIIGDGKLHAGVAVVPADPDAAADYLWYEAIKKAILHGQSAGAMERSLKRRAFDCLLDQHLVYPVYQPIVSLQHGEVFGYEALTRTEDRTWFDGPMELFHFAEQEGLSYTLDRLAREKAIDGCIQLGQEQKLFINVMAQIMEDPSFSPGQTLSLLEQHRLSPHNVVFEITERSSIADFGSVKKALEHYRSQGYQIAIDDVGAGYSSLQSIVELRPDFLKVDRSIIQNIHSDEMKAHILHTLVELAGKMGISLIAEGIELEEELAKVREMGVHYAQGYLLGKPAAFQP